MRLHLLGCTCCGEPADPFATRFTAVAFEATVSGHVLRSMADEEDDDFVGEPGTQAFAKEEDALTAILAAAMHDAGMAQRGILEQAVATAGDDMHRVQVALDNMDAAIGDIWTKDLEAQVGTQLSRCLASGARSVSQKADGLGDLSQDGPSLSVFEGIKKAVHYTTNRFFNTQIVPAITYQAEKILNAATPLDAPKLNPLLEVLDQRLRSVPYWNIVANAAASRGYHYGLARTAQMRGRTQYRFTAVVDQKTSKVCLHLNGKVFSIQEAVDIMEWIASVDTIEEVKQIAPWPKFRDIENLSESELEIRGWAVPPLHGRCRSTMVVL